MFYAGQEQALFVDMRKIDIFTRVEPPEQRPLVSNGNLARRQNSKRICATTACITSKAALLSLVWSFGVGSMYQLGYQPSNILSVYNRLSYEEYPIFGPVIYASTAIIFLFYPLSGFLADNRFGRYKTIIRSLQVLLVSFILGWLCLVIIGNLTIASDKMSLIGFYGSVSVFILLFFLVILGFVGFNANIIQFGMDQLFDSPADHQRLFIHWYVWIYYLTLLFTQIPWIMPDKFQYYSYFGILIIVYVIATFILLAISLVIALKKKHWFNIDTARVNPYKLVYKVSKFAWQHKVPIHRSAFTYCEDELPTGLDLGKRKYGGPFTTEEVENVKAFYGILKILFSLGPTFFLYIASDPALQWYVEHTYYIPQNVVESYKEYWNNTWHYSNYSYLNFKPYNIEMNIFLQGNILSLVLIVIFVPLYLFTLRSSLNRYIPSMIRRIGIGIFFLLASLISTFALDTVAQTHAKNSMNCMFTGYHGAYVFEDISLLAIPRSLNALSNMFIYIALYEFICAQSPNSMKGFLIGLSFAIKGLFQMFAILLIIPFSHVTSSFPSCGMYYYVMNISVGILALIVYICVARRYKYRKRDEICDIYRYAEEYYSNGQLDGK